MIRISRAQNLLRLPPVLSQSNSRERELESRLNSTSYCEDDIYKHLYHSLRRSGNHDNQDTQDKQDKLLGECWKWFCRYLDNSIKRDWKPILQATIKGLDPEYPKDAAEWPRQACNVSKVLRTIVDAISSRGDISIDGIIDELISQNVLRTGEQDGLRDATSNDDQIRQLTWYLIGITTMLYDPEPQLCQKYLSLRPSASNLRSGGRYRPGGSSAGQQNIAKCRDPLHALMAQFGHVLPKVEVDQEYLASVDIDYINVAYINFYALKHVAKLDIEWVNTLNLHLQLDKRRGTLRLFRFPAFCRLIWTEAEPSFMSQLFADHRKSQVNANLHSEYSFSDYLREVILSYRLLFGIDKHSRHALKAELPAWRRGLPHNHPNINSTIPSDSRTMDDPLLLLLCTESNTNNDNINSTAHQTPSRSQALNDLLWTLHGEEKSGQFDLEDFPFLGRRLAEIQRFSRKQKPNDWKSLFWVDRRDPQSFWSGWIAWILLIIGGGTIVLQFWQLVFQIWGTLAQVHQQCG